MVGMNGKLYETIEVSELWSRGGGGGVALSDSQVDFRVRFTFGQGTV